MPNKWTEHVKQWAKDHNSTYGCSISDPECKRSYALKYPKPVKNEHSKAKFNQLKKVQERRAEEAEKMSMASEDIPAPLLEKKRKPKPKPRVKKVTMEKANEARELFNMGENDIPAPRVKKAEDRHALEKQKMEMEQMGAEDFDAPKPKPKRKPRAPPKGTSKKQEEHNYQVSMFAQYFPEDEEFIEENVDKSGPQLKALAKKYKVDPKEEFLFMAILKARKNNPEMKGKGMYVMNSVEDTNGLTHVYRLSNGHIIKMCYE